MIDDYIESHIDEEPDYIKSLYHHANRELLYTRMMSGHVQGRFLKLLVEMIRPKTILELGTFAGYATLCLAEGLDEGGTIDTVEIDDELEPFLQKYMMSTPLSTKINLHFGDALTVVPRLFAEGKRWDLAFIDADKRAYPHYYAMLRKVMGSGSWVIADNTLWNGKVLIDKGHEPLKDTSDPQLKGIMEFNDMVAADGTVEKVILPLRDGITILHFK